MYQDNLLSCTIHNRRILFAHSIMDNKESNIKKSLTYLSLVCHPKMFKIRPSVFQRNFRIFKRWSSCSETDLKAVLASKITEGREKIIKFRKEHGKDKVGDVTVNMMYGGMRGLLGLICETSLVDPDEGIKFRGYSVPECQQKLPKAQCGEQPLPEGLFWLLVTGDIPTEAQVRRLSEEWAQRAVLPVHVCKFLANLPTDVHPMSQLSAACTILNAESEFAKALHKATINKTAYWEPMYEDAMNLIARVAPIAAIIYRHTFKGSPNVGTIDTSKDWSLNFCNMLGYDNPEFIELMRLYLTIHSDHEGGNVSAHATHLVGSALADAYLSYAAGMNGLAGPLHGLANQEVLIWLERLQAEVGKDPSKEKVSEFVNKTLKAGHVIPGYGHAVLRKTDPRFSCQREFALQHLPDYPLFKIVSLIFEVVPPILQKLGKVQNPWPNVDAHSGVLLQYYGLKEKNYYTVLFGVSRCLGVMASLIWSRALGLPIERPKSITTDLLKKKLLAKREGKKK